MRSVLDTVTLLGVVSAVGACSGSNPDTPDMVVRDSVGVRIVEHAALATPAQIWSADLDAGLEFATPDGDTPLFRVSNALRLADGRVVVADQGNNRILTFAADGSLLSRSGRAGDGPGEFRNMLAMMPWLGDSLVVWDDRIRRLSVFDPDIVFARSFRLDLPEDLPFARVLGTYPDGSFLGMSFTNMGVPPEPGPLRSPIRLHHFGVDGAHLGVLGEVPGTELIVPEPAPGQAPFYPPHFFRSGNHLASDRLLVAPNDTWELSYRSPSGEVLQIVRWLRAPEAVTPEATAASLEGLLERLPEERRAMARSVASDLDVHATMPAFDRVFYDRLGRVWLEDYDPSDAATSGWTVVGRDGDLVATIALPRTLLIRDAGDGWLLARVLDDLDVEHLVLVTIESADAS